MHKLLTLGLASLFLVVTGCQDTNTTGPLAGPDFHAMGAGDGLFEFDMLDDFATETTGASGFGIVKVRRSSVRVAVKAKGLLPHHAYELNVTIGPGGSFPPSTFVTFGPLTSDNHGTVEFREDLDLVGLFGPGTYRLDFFVTHDHSTGTGDFLGLDRDPLLRCAPFTTVTVVAEFDMLDDFATETTGAGGFGSAGIDENTVQINVRAKGLLPHHAYELNVTIDFASVATFTATSDKHGTVKFEEDLELAPGTYRLDFFITHDHPTIPEEDLFFPGLLDRDLLLRCAPFVRATIVADD